MGMIEKLVEKYRGTANLFCDKIEIEKNNNSEYQHALVGSGCKISVAGFNFDFDNVTTDANEISGLDKMVNPYKNLEETISYMISFARSAQREDNHDR